MDLVDIATWTSTEIKEVTISQIFLDAPFKLMVREFSPVEGDMLEEVWKSGDVTVVYKLPRFAIVEMEEAAGTIGSFIDRNIGQYITAVVHGAENLLWCTYFMAFKQISNAHVSPPRRFDATCLTILDNRRASADEGLLPPLGIVLDDNVSKPYRW